MRSKIRKNDETIFRTNLPARRETPRTIFGLFYRSGLAGTTDTRCDARLPDRERDVRTGLPQQLAQPLGRSNLGGNSRGRLVAGKREAGTRTPPRRHSGNSGRCDPLARRRARQLVRPSGDHGRLRQQPQHLAGTGRRRTICSSDSEVKPADPSMTAARIDVRAALVSSTPGTPRRAGTPAGSKASGRHRRRTRPTASGR